MKKIMLFAAACAVLAACNKNIESTTPKLDNPNAFVKGQEVTLSVSAPSSTKVSSSLDATSGAVSFKWEKGDKIKVTVGTESAEFILESGAGESSATFKGTMPASGETFDVQFPATDPDLSSQDYTAEGLPHNMMTATATGCSTSGKTFVLTPQNAALRLNLYGTSQTVGKIVVTNTSSTATTKPSYTLNCKTTALPNGVSIGTSSSATTPFLIVIPVSEIAADNTYKFKVEIFDAAATPASICSFETTGTKTFEAKKVLNMEAKEVKKAAPVFSVSATTKVLFSKGNLYYDGSAFKFETDQLSTATEWDYNHISHFFWSKTASEACAAEFNSDTGVTDIFFTNENENTPKNSFTVAGQTGVWRTLSKDEWTYLLSERTVNGGKGVGNSYKRATVSGVSGVIIYPNGYTSQTTTTSYTSLEWTTLENAGCVFLRVAGKRYYDPSVEDVNSVGAYWSSTSPYIDTWDDYYAYFLDILDDSGLKTKESTPMHAYSVRLVCAAPSQE